VTCIFFIAVVFGPIAAFCGFSLLRSLIRYVWEELPGLRGDDIIGGQYFRIITS